MKTTANTAAMIEALELIAKSTSISAARTIAMVAIHEAKETKTPEFFVDPLDAFRAG